MSVPAPLPKLPVGCVLCFFLEVKGWGVKLTTHPILAPRLSMGGAIPLLPPYTFLASTAENLFTVAFLSHVIVPQLVSKLPVLYAPDIELPCLRESTNLLSQMNPVYVMSIYYVNIHSNIILPSTLRSSNRSFIFN